MKDSVINREDSVPHSIRKFYRSLLVLALMLTSCSKLAYKPGAATIKFNGIKSVFETKEGHYIVTWEKPLDTSAPVTSYEVYMVEVPQTLALLGDTAAANTGVAVELAPETTPAVKGNVIGTASDTSFTVQELLPGNYLFQVKAVGADGQHDGNNRAFLMAISLPTRFAGLTSADLIDGKIVLHWPAFTTELKGEPVYYIVYQGDAFNTPLAFVEEGILEYSVPTDDKPPGSVWSYGVRVKDPLGVVDRNSSIKRVQIPEDTTPFEGCVSAKALGSSQINLTFEYPAKAEKMRIYRNGVEAFVTQTPGTTEFADIGLLEGQEYKYSCEGTFLGIPKLGSKVITISTLTTNPPTFSGITNATISNTGTVTASWGVSTGVPSAYFAIFGNIGKAVDWGATPLQKTSDPAQLTADLTGFGDELNYAFGVRACTAANVCDANTVTISIAVPDLGPPKTPGATSASVADAKMTVVAPWEPKDGAVLKRRLYIKTGTTGYDNFENFVLTKTFVVEDLLNPPTDLLIGDLVENTEYHIVVRDEDPSGNVSTNFNVISKNSGDLNPPAFAGITALKIGPNGQKDTALTVSFTTIPSEGADPSGASHYQVYVKKGGGNACSAGTLHVEFAASAYQSGQSTDYNATGLLPRTVYSVCMKARDSAGNVSKTDSFLIKSTQDTTAPAFDGVQNLTYSANDGRMNAVWNPTTSADAIEYRIKLWKNAALPEAGSPLTLTRSVSGFKNGFSFDKTQYPFGSNDTLYMIVNACDDAAVIPGGTQNCTDFPVASALRVTLADIDPPPGFAGIAAETQLQTPLEGTIEVAWIAPADWSDYRGFKIYTVATDLTLTFIKQCACAANGCPDQLTSCTVTGLDPFRTYRFHVRAYDLAGNATILDPQTRSTSKKASDTTPPAFSSNLALAFGEGKANLSWAPATDNQYASEPGATITYLLYRKTASGFSDGIHPATDGELITETPGTVYADNKDFVSGTRYYYAVCAKDGAGNVTCDGNIKPITTPDLIPPVIATFTTTKTADAKTWSLNWTVSDNVAGPLLIKVRQSLSANGPGTVSDSDSTIVSGYDLTTLANVSGPLNSDTYVNYQLSVEDDAGNVTSQTVSVLSLNKIQVTSVQSTEGPTSGGTVLVINGDGFHTSSTVKLGTSPCSGVQAVSRKIILCTTPASSAQSAVDVTVTNSDGSIGKLVEAYTYCIEANCTKLCNTPTVWGQNFAGGDGSTFAPFIICNDVHLNAVRSYGHGKTFQLGDNVDLGTYSNNDFLPIFTHTDNVAYLNLDGKGYVIANYHYAAPPLQDFVGLFTRLGGGYNISNLGLVNVDVSGNSYVGGLLGYVWAGETNKLDRIFVTGDVHGEGNYVGGIAGQSNIQMLNSYSTATVSGKIFVGGLAGEHWGTMFNTYATGDITAAGIVGDHRCHVGGLAGSLRGNGQTLVGPYSTGIVTCSATGNNYNGGLFGAGDNFSLKDCYTTGDVVGTSQTGGLVGAYSSGTIDNCHTTGKVTGEAYVGGLIGVMSTGTVKNSHSTGLVTCSGDRCGGALGQGTSLTVDHVYSTSKVAGTTDHIGGLIGLAGSSTIKDSYAKGEVSGRGAVGGMLGNSGSGNDVLRCYATGKVTALGSGVGGLIGNQDGNETVNESYATGETTGLDNVGGLIGTCRTRATKTAQNNYASGNVSGRNFVGGFCGYLYPTANTLADFSLNYATGNVDAIGDWVGGFIGRMDSYPSNGSWITQNYASGDVSGQNYTGGFLGGLYYQDGKVIQNFATGNVTGLTNVGGFLGYNNWGYGVTQVYDNYARGDVSGGQYTGGFIGYTADTVKRGYSTGNVSQAINGVGIIGGAIGGIRYDATYGLGNFPNIYWDLDNSGVTTSAAGNGRATADMKVQGTFGNFNFTTDWVIPAANSYPEFIWEQQ